MPRQHFNLKKKKKAMLENLNNLRFNLIKKNFLMFFILFFILQHVLRILSKSNLATKNSNPSQEHKPSNPRTQTQISRT